MAPRGGTHSYRRWLIVVLVALFSFNNADMLALGLVLQSVKTDLSLTDTQLGFLTGIAFALFNAVMGLPLANWADRGNRVTVIFVTTALWGIMVLLTGHVGNFAQLLAVRVGAAIGQAGCTPTANSLLPDYFSRFERPRAASLLMLGGPFGLGIGYCAAGWINEYYGWRATFTLLGVCGLALALIAWCVLREPRSENPRRYGDEPGDGSSSSTATHLGLWDAVRVLFKNTTLRYLLAYTSVISFFGFASGQWLPAYFIRSYGLSTGELGTWFAVTQGTSGVLAMVLGGELASRYAAGNERLQLRVASVAGVAVGLLWAGVYLAPTYPIAFVLMSGATVLGAAATGPIFALIQTLSPGSLRAQSAALVNLFANLIGLGLGPLAAGVLSDHLRSWAGPESLRYALLFLSPGAAWAAWYLYRASASVTEDLNRIDKHEAISDGTRLASSHV